MPWNRPDERIHERRAHHVRRRRRAAVVAAILVGGAPACTTSNRECHTARAEIGQDIYTPSSRASDPVAAADARPNAGWLYLSQTRALAARSDAPTSSRSRSASPARRRSRASRRRSRTPRRRTFNRPTDWTRQIAFEPGVDRALRAAAPARRRRRADRLRSDSASRRDGRQRDTRPPRSAFSRAPDGTCVIRGCRARRHRSRSRSSADVSGRAVARDLFLDGNTFRGGPRVGHEPFVGSARVGRRASLSRVHPRLPRGARRAASYAARPEVASVVVDDRSVTFDR